MTRRPNSEQVARASHGVTARELVERLGDDLRGWLTPSALEAWLLREGLAEPNGKPDRLVPTMRAREVAAGLTQLG